MEKELQWQWGTEPISSGPEIGPVLLYDGVSQRSLPRTDLVSYKDDSGDPMAASILLPFAAIHSFIHLFI